ncbi:MAG: DUF2335 domain-containing protein [Phycisphaerae bacterium]|nr:DUF2335 domain-containing protein [Phycisphaerae bacterium]
MTRRKNKKKHQSTPVISGNTPSDATEKGNLVAFEQRTEMSGPLPPPQILEKYNQICPGAAERILSMAEKQARHRQEVESKALEAGIADAKSDRTQIRRGQYLGFVIAFVGVAGGVYAVVKGAGWAGTAVAGAPLVGLVTALIYGRKPKHIPEETIKDQ